MENLNEYIEVLRNGLICLSVPVGEHVWFMDARPKGGEKLENAQILLPFSTYFSEQEKKIYFFLEKDFEKGLIQYELGCQQMINKCRTLRSEVVLQEVFKLAVPLEVSVKLYIRTMEKHLLPLLSKVKNVANSLIIYQGMIDNSDNTDLKNSYASFMITWHNLLNVIIAKQRVLRNELTNVYKDMENSKMMKQPEQIDSSSIGLIDMNLTFHKRFSFVAARELHSLLIEKKFIDSSTTLGDLCCVFSVSCEEEQGGRPIKWIKQNSRVGNKKVNRTSLIDLLTLLGYVQKDIIGEEGQKYKKINNCFQVGGRPFKANDFTSNMRSKDVNEPLKVTSEYHDILVDILSKVSLPIH